MEASIIAIGNEILSGETLDSNSRYISQRLNEHGIRVVKTETLPDERESLREAVQRHLEISDLVFTTGGLGPTRDDITKNVLAELFQCQLEFRDEIYRWLKAYFQSRGMKLSKMNESQAYIPSKARAFINKEGTAPGMFFENKGKAVFSMPGVPREMKYLLEKEFLPYLKRKYPLSPVFHKNIQTVGIRESVLAEKTGDIAESLPEGIQLAYLPSTGRVKIRLSATGMEKEEFEKKSESVVSAFQKKAGKYIYGYGHETLPEAIGKLLKKHNTTLSAAESCTGGYLSHLITMIPGSSGYFAGGVVSYSNEVKMNQLKVKASTLKEYGAVSRETVREMAKGCLNKFSTTYAVSVSGVAGPSGGTEEKPVGTVWIAAGSQVKIITRKFRFFRDREKNIHISGLMGLDLLRRLILNLEY